MIKEVMMDCQKCPWVRRDPNQLGNRMKNQDNKIQELENRLHKMERFLCNSNVKESKEDNSVEDEFNDDDIPF